MSENFVLSMRRIAARFFPRPGLTKNIMTVVSHPPISHGLAPCHILTIPVDEIISKSRRLYIVQVIQEATQVILSTFTLKGAFSSDREGEDVGIV